MKLLSLPAKWKTENTAATPEADKKPRICILTETYYPHIGGGESQALLLAEGLTEQGFSVTLITRRTSKELKPFELFGSLPVYRIPPTGVEHYKKWGLLLTGFPALIRLARHYDVIFVSGYRILGIPAVLVSRLFGKSCILKADNNGEMSGEYFKGGLAKIGFKPQSQPFKLYLALRNTILRWASGFVAISSDIAHELQANGINAAEKIYEIPNSVDTDIFHPVNSQEKAALRNHLNLPAYSPLVTFTGRLVSYKGLPTLIKVWTDVVQAHPEARLLLIGSGSLDIYNYEKELKQTVQANQLQDLIIFTGPVKNVHEYLQASDIFVFPTEKEAFGISLIEAMACGLPVITTSVGGLKDIVQNGVNGLVIEKGNSRQLYEAADKLLSNHSLRRSLGSASRHTVMERYSADYVTHRYIDLFYAVQKS